MSTGELVNLMFLAFVSGGLGVTFWRRLSEFRDDFKGDIASLRQEIGGLREEMRQEIGGLREEMGGLRQEMAIMRSDLTQVALAVGTRPRASND